MFGFLNTGSLLEWPLGVSPLWIGFWGTLREGKAYKLHLVVNDRGELLNLKLTPGNTDDRKLLPQLLRTLFGKVFADKGYVSEPLAQQLRQTWGIELFAKPRRNIKNHLMRLTDKLLARKRSIIESVIDEVSARTSPR